MTDLKSRTPGMLDEASRAFVERVARRRNGIGATASDLNRPANTADPDPEINDTSLPLDSGDDGAISEATRDIDNGRENSPDGNNPNDAGEDETVTRDI